MDSVACIGLAFIVAIATRSYSTRYTIAEVLISSFLVLYLFVKYYRLFLYHKYFSPLRHLPGPKALNLINAETPTALYIKWMREHPEAPLIRFLTFANGEVIVCNSPDAFKDVLQTKCYSFQKSSFFRRLTREITGHGLVTMEGEAHGAHRKIRADGESIVLNPVFSLNNITKLEPVIQEKAIEINRLLSRAIYAGNGGTATIDCTAIFVKATLDVMGITLFGVDLAGLESTNFGSADEKPDARKGNQDMSFPQAYDSIFGQETLGKILMFANAFVPVRWMPLEANRRYLAATTWIENFFIDLVRKRRGEIINSVKNGTYLRGESRDVLSFIIEESLPGGPAEDITEEEIIGDLKQLIAAAHDTSANVLSWTLYTMATRVDIQNELRKELETLGQDPDVEFSKIDTLPYLNNFVRETLRVYATATTTHRQATTDETICGTFVPKGTTFDIVPHVTLMNPSIWGDDVDEFKPSRWADGLSEVAQSPYAFSTFSNGPRICLGKSVAMREIKIVLVELVRNFRFLKVDGPFTVENPSLTLRPRGLRVVLEHVHM